MAEMGVTLFYDSSAEIIGLRKQDLVLAIAADWLTCCLVFLSMEAAIMRINGDSDNRIKET